MIRLQGAAHCTLNSVPAAGWSASLFFSETIDYVFVLLHDHLLVLPRYPAFSISKRFRKDRGHGQISVTSVKTGVKQMMQRDAGA